jgi:type II secretory pathway pseudopilin PulG
MIVVLVIGIIAALAIPLYMRHRITANETSAISSLRTIATAQSQFKTASIVDLDSDGDADYGTLEQLGDPPPGATVPFIDAVLSDGIKQGYAFTMTVIEGGAGTNAGFVCTADPIVPDRSGVRRFYVSEGGVIRATSDGSPATEASAPIG